MKICTIPCGTAFMYEHSIYYRNSDGSYTNSYGDTDSYENHFGPDRKLRYEKVIRLQSKKISEVEDGEVFIHSGRSCSVEGGTYYVLNENQEEFTLFLDCSCLVLEEQKEGKGMVQNTVASDSLINPEDFIRQVDRCIYDLSKGLLGVKNSNNDKFSVFEPPKTAKSKPSISLCEIAQFGHKVPAYAVRTEITDLKQGDVVIIKDANSDENWLYFLSVDKDGSTENVEITGIETDSGKKVALSVQDSLLLGGNSVLSVKNFLGDKKNMKNMLLPLMLMSQGQNGGNNALLAMMMMSGEGADNNMLLPLMMMQGQNGGAPMDPMMLMMMGGGKEGGVDMEKMLPFMLMTQQGGTMNPLVMMMMMNGGKMPTFGK